jgi:hypothetical protein
MNVYEQRLNISRLLSRELESSYIIVSGPDHPLLIEGPDALVGGIGGLLAVFLVKSKERVRPELLKVRYILSRLALPPNARLVLVLSEAKDEGIAQRLGSSFATILTWQSRHELAKISRDTHFVGFQRKLPPEVTEFVRHRYEDALYATRLMQRANRSIEMEKVRERVFKQFPRTGRPNKTDFQHVAPDMLLTKFGQGAPDSISIRSLADQTTLAGFDIGEGVPYPTHKDDYGLAIVDELPEYRGDPDKLVRAAAFAGWGFIPDEQEHRTKIIAQRLNDRRKAWSDR